MQLIHRNVFEGKSLFVSIPMNAMKTNIGTMDNRCSKTLESII